MVTFMLSMIPLGLLTAALGVFPVLYSLDVVENHQVDRFLHGWVFDEMVAEIVLNPRGIAAAIKP